MHVVEQNLVNSTTFCSSLPFFADPSLAGLAIVSVWQSCGKPSTKFPHRGLVECSFIENEISNKELLSEVEHFKNSSKIFIFLKFLKICDLNGEALTLAFLPFITSISICNIRSTTFSVHFSQCDNAKSC